MMAHPLYEIDKKNRIPRRLQKLARAWQKKNEAPLDKRQKLLRLWASGFFDMGYQREHLINIVDRGIFTIVPYLVEGNPKILVETIVGNYRPWAYSSQLTLNFLIEKMNLAETVLIPAAINSMFGAGIVRTFTEYNRQINLENESIKSGSPVIRVIDDADYIGDVAAKTREDNIIEGDIYKIPTKYARELFHKDADLIMPDCKLVSEYSPDKVSHGEFDINRLSLREYSTFMDIFLKDEGVTVTIMPEGKKAKILQTVEEDGPGGTPYDFLGYKFFPGTTYPIPPAWSWHDLDVTMNVLARTAREQAESQKDVLFIEPSHKDLKDKILNARNLDVMEHRNPKEGVNQVSLGGVNPDNYNWLAFAEAQFTKSGANPDIMRGAKAQAPTLGQEKLLYANASRIVNNMYTRWHSFMTSVIKKLAWKVWTDPMAYIQTTQEIPGIGDLPVVFSQADKVGDFYDYVFKIIPYSSQRKSPETMYQDIMGFMAQWVLPTYQFAAQQGAELDVPMVTKIMADYLGVNSFSQWYKTAIPQSLDVIPYQMQPVGGERKKGEARQNIFGQANDSMGAGESSRMANLAQQQARTTMKGTS